MTPPPALGDHPDPNEQPRGDQLARLRLRLPAAGCSECRRVAQAVLEGLEGVLLVQAVPGNEAIAVTYDPGRIDPAHVRTALQEAGCTST